MISGHKKADIFCQYLRRYFQNTFQKYETEANFPEGKEENLSNFGGVSQKMQRIKA